MSGKRGLNLSSLNLSSLSPHNCIFAVLFYLFLLAIQHKNIIGYGILYLISIRYFSNHSIIADNSFYSINQSVNLIFLFWGAAGAEVASRFAFSRSKSTF